MWGNDLETKARNYAASRNLILGEPLGDGFDGSVWEVQSNVNGNGWAVKLHRNVIRYATEKACYLRLDDQGIVTVRGLSVPQLLRSDDQWKAIEMTKVQAPFLLDFAAASLDTRPSFSQEILDQWHADLEERYGERMSEVLLIIKALERLGIYLTDIHPGNLRFE